MQESTPKKLPNKYQKRHLRRFFLKTTLKLHYESSTTQLNAKVWRISEINQGAY